MGNCCLPIPFRRRPSAINPKSVTLLLVGLDNAGKTTIAKRLAGEPVDSVVPTVGFSVITLRQKGCHVSIYDLGGGQQIRDIWPRYYADAHGVIFVADAQDTSRMEECHYVLQNILQHEQISGKPILLLANKQDLEGALDEIDIVDRLNLEKLVNDQKCPTLVELCSALYFSKKMDIGIDNGYKWLIRSVIKDYPSLNNRVKKDLAKQEEENMVHVIKKSSDRLKNKQEDENAIISYIDVNPYIDPIKPVKKIVEEKSYPNGIPKSNKSVARIPGFIEDMPEKLKGKKNQIQRIIGEEIISVPETRSTSTNSYSSEFFIYEHYKSDMELLNDVPNQTFKNFLVRPKSSGARLYGVRPEKKKTHRRKPLKKQNKTGPSPFTDITNDENTKIPIALDPRRSSKDSDITFAASSENHNLPDITSADIVNPFIVGDYARYRRKSEYEMKVFGEADSSSKSMPNSRKGSGNYGNSKIRNSVVNGKLMEDVNKIEKIPPLKMNGRLSKEVLLDVAKLGN